VAGLSISLKIKVTYSHSAFSRNGPNLNFQKLEFESELLNFKKCNDKIFKNEQYVTAYT